MKILQLTGYVLQCRKHVIFHILLQIKQTIAIKTIPSNNTICHITILFDDNFKVVVSDC